MRCTRFAAVSSSDPPESPVNHSRRRALRIGGGGVLALVIGAVAGWADRRDDGPPSARPSPPSTGSTTTTSTTTTTVAPVTVPEIGEVDPRIIVLGQRVIEVTGEVDLDELLAQLPKSDLDPIRAATDQVAADFEAGDTVVVDGWVLAVSEARAAAAVALICEASEC